MEITVAAAADRMGISTGRVRQLVLAGRIAPAATYSAGICPECATTLLARFVGRMAVAKLMYVIHGDELG